MSDKAVVKKILSEDTALIVKLPGERPHKECTGCGGCGASTEKIETIALNLLDAKPGDTVYIETDEKKSIKLLFILVASPIIIPLTMYFIGYGIGLPTPISGGMAGLGLYMAYRLIRYHNNKVKSEPPITTITQILEKEKVNQIGITGLPKGQQDA